MVEMKEQMMVDVMVDNSVEK
jgi:hypothetical protein